MGQGFDSLRVLGNQGPYDGMDVKTRQGFCVPAGHLKSNFEKNSRNDSYRRIGYNEYIVYDEKRVVIRYLVKLGNGKNRYDEDTGAGENNMEDSDEEMKDSDDDEIASSICSGSNDS